MRTSRLLTVVALLCILAAPSALAGICRGSAGPCDPAEYDTLGWFIIFFWYCPGDSLYGPSTVCRPSTGVCDPQETCTGGSAACPSDVVYPDGTLCRGAAGDCDIAEQCSGGVCPSDQMVAQGVVCRNSTGLCDVAELCTGSTSACPVDAYAANGVVCRRATDLCDAPEICPGDAVACPTDELRPANYVCRAAAGVCDAAEQCDGSSTACPTDVKVSGSTCRATAGICDAPEYCNGDSNDCPTDAKRGPSYVCRSSTGSCDPAEKCSGSSNTCPPDVSGAVVNCSGNPFSGLCDAPDQQCAGDSACPDLVQNAGAVCRPSVGVCDLPEACDGSDKGCPGDLFQPSTILCRPARNLCDTPEYCTGTGPQCPDDTFEPATVSCDDAAICNGFSRCDGNGNCAQSANQRNGYSCAATTDVAELAQLGTCMAPNNAMCGDGACICQRCGDGIVAPIGVEQCDDGNTNSTDGCGYPSCTVTWGWTCNGVGADTECTTECGDARLAAGVEQCDDGNVIGGDGCSQNCTIEFGYECTGPLTSDCAPRDLLEADTYVVAGSSTELQNATDLDYGTHGAEPTLRLSPGSYILLRFSLSYLLPRASLLPLPLSRIALSCFNWTGPANGRDVLPHISALVALANETISWDENSTSWNVTGSGVVGAGRPLPLDASAQRAQALSEPLDWTWDSTTGDLRAHVGPMLQWLLREKMPGVTVILTMRASNYSATPYLECRSKEWVPPPNRTDSNNARQLSRTTVPTSFVPPQWKPRLTFTADLESRSSGGKGRSNRGVAVGVAIGVGLPLLFGCCLVLLVLVAAAAVLLYFVRQRTRVKRREVMRGEELRDISVSDEILAEDLELLEQLGAGAGGMVFRGRWTQGGGAPVDVAVKRLAATELQSFEEMTAEVEMIRHLRHPHVLRYYGICFKQGDTLLVTELMSKGSLDNMLHRDGVRLSLEQLVKYGADAATGLNYLHHQHIVHRDVKPGNMLVNSADTLKIGDFGISRIVDNTKTMTQIGTPVYSAPEVLKGLRYTDKADVYSFGVTLIEMWNHERPFQGMLPPQVVMAVIGGVRPELNAGAPPRLAKIIQQCLAPEESGRPSFDKVLEQLHTLQVDLAWERNKSGASTAAT